MLNKEKGNVLEFVLLVLQLLLWTLYVVCQRWVWQMNAAAISKSLHVLRPLCL